MTILVKRGVGKTTSSSFRHSGGHRDPFLSKKTEVRRGRRRRGRRGGRGSHGCFSQKNVSFVASSKIGRPHLRQSKACLDCSFGTRIVEHSHLDARWRPTVQSGIRSVIQQQTVPTPMQRRRRQEQLHQGHHHSSFLFFLPKPSSTQNQQKKSNYVSSSNRLRRHCVPATRCERAHTP